MGSGSVLWIHQSESESWCIPDEGVFQKQSCINYWFPDCWIRKPNFYYGLVDLEWFFLIMDFWIQNAYFELRIGESRMVFSNVLHFLFWIDTIIHVISEASIQEITGCANPKIYWKRQSKNLPDFIIRNIKKNVQFIEEQFYLCATLWGCRKKLPMLI